MTAEHQEGVIVTGRGSQYYVEAHYSGVRHKLGIAFASEAEARLAGEKELEKLRKGFGPT